MSNVLSDPTKINIMTESDLSNIIENFDYSIILDIIEGNIAYRFNAINDLSNLPSVCEIVFKENMNNLDECGPYMDQLKITRENTYKTILSIICNKFGFTYNEDINDTYTAAQIIYNLLVSDFKNTIINFYSNYILSEVNGIYDGFGIGRFKKQKDSTTAYNKQIYDDQKLGLIISNLSFVLDNMRCFEIPFSSIINYVYKDDPTTRQYILENFSCNVDFYRDIILPIYNSAYKSIIITEIRFKIDSLSSTSNLSILDIKQANQINEE